MNEEELERVGRIMAGILRHFPDRYGLQMDGRGWVDMSEFVGSIRSQKRQYRWLKPHHIAAIVETDPKGRYQLDGGMVRATYAHSVDVTLDDLPDSDADELYYPCSEEEVDLLLEHGLKPTDRGKIHLSGTLQKAVEAGKAKMEAPIILAIDAAQATKDDVSIKRAGKAVYVADQIDPKYLKRLENVDTAEAAAGGGSDAE